VISDVTHIARALKFLRQRNLIHRDIKPQNLLLKPATEVDYDKGHPLGIPLLKIADFGFARHLPNTMMAETLCGSPLYMAPEILRYEKYDAKADLWSVGAVLYEISVGKPPFRAQNHIELLKRIEQARSTVRFPDEEDPNVNKVPDDIKKLIRALLKRHPVERASFEEFFASKAMANSKFPAPKSPIENPNPPSGYSPKSNVSNVTPISNGKPLPPNVMVPHIPPNHRIIPPEVLDPKALIPRSNFHFRKTGGAGSVSESRKATSSTGSGPTTSGLPARTSPGTSPVTKPSPLRRPIQIAPELSVAVEAEEESILKGEYVVIKDTKHVEFNQRVDGLYSLSPSSIRSLNQIYRTQCGTPAQS
jgi:serine/threonine-protein kinase ULK2